MGAFEQNLKKKNPEKKSLMGAQDWRVSSWQISVS